MMESDISSKGDKEKQRPVKRRARMALSCQRCRKYRSKCSRARPSCEECIQADEPCNYLDVPGDLESTALRDRFSGLEDQIQSLISEFSVLEDIVHTPQISTQSLSKWSIHQAPGSAGLSIDTHMSHVTEIYSTLLKFARENSTNIVYPPIENNNTEKPIWLTRNNDLFRHVQLSHFTSLKPTSSDQDLSSEQDVNSPSSYFSLESEDDENESQPEPLPSILNHRLLSLYKHCLLYGAVQPFEALFAATLMSPLEHQTPVFQLLYASIVCHMLPHAYYWHREIFNDTQIDQAACEEQSRKYYRWAKHLLSSLYFDTPSLMTCHAICNLVLYHMEYGNTSVVYLYSGMAVRMALSLQLYREDALEDIAAEHACVFPGIPKPAVALVKQYARSLLWFMYFIDTASSHYHNKPYEIHLDDHVSTTTYFRKENPPASIDPHQTTFQYIEFNICQMTRDIRRTIFNPEERQTSYQAIERIEQKLLKFQTELPSLTSNPSTVWEKRCVYTQWIRHHGHWILLHQSFLPTPISVQRCTDSALALVDLFDQWDMDCYFRPCIHELKQACEILLYHVDQNTDKKWLALGGLIRLITVLLKTPVSSIARTRPFVQRVMEAIHKNNMS